MPKATPTPARTAPRAGRCHPQHQAGHAPVAQLQPPRTPSPCCRLSATSPLTAPRIKSGASGTSARQATIGLTTN